MKSKATINSRIKQNIENITHNTLFGSAFIPQIFEYLRCVRPCCKYWANCNNKIDQIPTFKELTF